MKHFVTFCYYTFNKQPVVLHEGPREECRPGELDSGEVGELERRLCCCCRCGGGPAGFEPRHLGQEAGDHAPVVEGADLEKSKFLFD